MTNHNQSVDDASGLHAERLAALRHLAPELFGSDDGAIDADALLAYFNVGSDVRTREAFNFTWVGKRDAIVAAGLPPTGTLVPEHSTAQHSTAQR